MIFRYAFHINVYPLLYTSSKLLLILGVFIAYSATICAASFDCKKAVTLVETTICAKDEISNLDSQVAQLYNNALDASVNLNSIKYEQNSWLKNVRDKCTNTECLKNAYLARIDELNKINAVHSPLMCESEKIISSSNSIFSTSVKFFNLLDKTIRVYWINYSGKRVFYREIQKNSEYEQQTYLTHPWVVTDEYDNCLGVYYPDGQLRVINISK